MGNSAYSAVIFIIHSIAQLYLLVLLLRLFLPWLGINFNNPISQGILRLTSPLVIVLILGLTPSILPITVTAIVELAILTIRLFVFAIIIRIVLSWISPAGSYNPAIAVIDAITEPVLRPFRRLVPPIGGLDISPIFAIILLSAAAILISGLKQVHY